MLGVNLSTTNYVRTNLIYEHISINIDMDQLDIKIRDIRDIPIDMEQLDILWLNTSDYNPSRGIPPTLVLPATYI